MPTSRASRRACPSRLARMMGALVLLAGSQLGVANAAPLLLTDQDAHRDGSSVARVWLDTRGTATIGIVSGDASCRRSPLCETSSFDPVASGNSRAYSGVGGYLLWSGDPAWTDAAPGVFIDLVNHDRIKAAYGSAVAEQSLLRSVIKLRRLVRDVDTVGRLGDLEDVLGDLPGSMSPRTRRPIRFLAPDETQPASTSDPDSESPAQPLPSPQGGR